MFLQHAKDRGGEERGGEGRRGEGRRGREGVWDLLPLRTFFHWTYNSAPCNVEFDAIVQSAAMQLYLDYTCMNDDTYAATHLDTHTWTHTRTHTCTRTRTHTHRQGHNNNTLTSVDSFTDR